MSRDSRQLCAGTRHHPRSCERAGVTATIRRSLAGARYLGAIDAWIRALAEELDPCPLHARVVLRSFDEVHEVGDVRVEARLQLFVREPVVFREGIVRLREREHVGVHTRAEMLERDTQRPQAAIPATIDGEADRRRPCSSLKGCGR